MGASAQPIVGDARWRCFCLGVIAATVICLSAVGVVNAVVDPFQQYRISTWHLPRYYRLHHRFIDPGIAKHAEYRTVLIGSSITENNRNDDVAETCGGPAVNLAMPAISASEIRTLLGTVFDRGEPKRVLLVLDFNSFAGAPDARQEVAGPLPAYLYDRNPFNDLAYLLSGTVLRKSLSILAGRADEPFRTDANAPWYWADQKQFGRSEVLRGLDLAHLNARFQQPARTQDEMRASFERNIMPFLAGHPATEFDLVWPPYSLLVWKDFAQRDQLDVTFAFKRYVAQRTERLGNVRITDLQGHAEITTNLDRYLDIYHFGPGVNRWMIERTCAGLDRENSGNVAAFERELRDQTSNLTLP